LLGKINLLVDLAYSNNLAARNLPIFATLEATTTTIEVLCNVLALRQRRFTLSLDLSSCN
jgi:hypothetical protein